MSSGFLTFMIVLLSTGLSGCRWIDDNFNKDIQPLEIDTHGIEYQIIWPADLPSTLKSVLQQESALVKLEHRPPISLAGLVKRCKKDLDSFKKGLASLGYFQATVSCQIEEQASPVQVVIKLETGPCYKIGKIEAVSLDNKAINDTLNPVVVSDIIHLKPGDTVNLEKVLNGAARLKKYLQNMGYPFAEVDTPEGILNTQSHTLDIVYKLKPDYLSRIDFTEIHDLKNLDEDFIRNRLQWKDGDVFAQDKLENTRRTLLATGLLASATITVEKQGPPNSVYQPVKMIVKVPEGATRAIGAGIRFSTSEKIGGNLFWHHNNIKRHGEHLGVSFRSSKRETKAKFSYDVPDFIIPLQTLKNEIVLLREKNRAYTGRTFNLGTRVQRPLNDFFEAALGVTGEEGRIIRENQVYKTRLIGIPGELKGDFTDNLLDPTHGIKISTKITPYFGRVGQTRGMVKGLATLSGYLPFMTNEVGESQCVFAGFIKGGSIFNQNLNSLPPNKRFYAGGGGSIRGYGYQLLGPVDSQRVPEGGKSLAELGTELRIKTSETIGFVTFIEGGSVTKGRKPEFLKNVLWGGGFGLRYYSPLGPVRADIAFPAKRRRDINGKPIDSPFQVYLSVGQAF